MYDNFTIRVCFWAKSILALREASEQGTHCLALAVRDKGEAYLTQMFGTHGWMLLPDVHSLPSHFVSVATDFLKS